MNKILSKNKGSILMEAMVAMAIFVVGMSFVLLLFVSSSKGAIYSLEGTKASLISTQSMEAMRSILNDRGWLPVGTYEVGLKDDKEWDIISTEGLVGHWKLSGDARDYSGNGNDGTLMGGVTWSEDRMGQAKGAAEFDGESGYVEVDSLSDVGENNITYSLWVKPNTNGHNSTDVYNFDTFMGKHGSGYSGDLAVGYRADNKVRVYYENLSIGNYIDSINPIIINEWTHVTVVTNSSSVSLYVNGVLNSIGNIATNFVIDKMGIGNAILLDTWTTHFNGQIDDVRVYNRALSEAEIKALYGHYSDKYQSSVTVGDGITDGLVGYWPMNEGQGSYVYDYSPRTSNHGKFFGPYLDFDGVDDYVGCGSDSSLDITEEITVSAWIKLTTLGLEQKILAKAQSSTKGYEIFIGSDNKIRSRVGAEDNASERDLIGDSVSLGNWYHVVMTWDGTTQKLYANGSLSNSKGTSGTSGNPEYDLTVGRRSDASSLFFNGLIDDARVYNRALSAEEVSKLYKGEWVSDTGLVGHWEMDEGHGGQVRDKSGNGNHGTIYGATWGSSAPEWVDDTSGGALEFDGVDDYVEVDDNSIFAGDSVTISFWFKSTMTSSGSLVWKERIGSGGSYWIRMEPESNQIRVLFRDSSNNSANITTSQIYNNGEWHYFVVTYNGSSGQIYVDNEEDGSTFDSIYSWDSDESLYIGAQWGTESFFNGQIDDVRVYNRALSEAEIQKIYEYGRTNKFYLSE